MQELIVNILLIVVAVLAAVLRLIGQKPDSGMTKKQKIMLWRILAATVLLLAFRPWVRPPLTVWAERDAGFGWPSIWRTTSSSDTTFSGRPGGASGTGRSLMRTF